MQKQSKLAECFHTYDAIVFFDTETTGLDPAANDIIELAALRIHQGDDGKLVLDEKMDDLLLLPPGKTIPPEITKLTGINDQMLSEHGKPRDQSVETFRKMLRGRTLLVAHNAQFDILFARAELERTAAGAGDLERCDYLDSLTVYKDRAPCPHKLANAIEHYSLQGKVRNSHRAIDDVTALYCVTYAMAEERPDLSSYVNIFGYNQRYGIMEPPLPKVKYHEQQFNDTIVDPDKTLPEIIHDEENTGEQMTLADFMGGQNNEHNGNNHNSDNMRHSAPALSDQQDRQRDQGQGQRQEMNRATCRSCGSAIVWIRTLSGRNMPCDAKPINYIIKPGAATKLVTPGGDVVSCEVVEDPRDAQGWGYSPHWASCPAADQHRRR